MKKPAPFEEQALALLTFLAKRAIDDGLLGEDDSDEEVVLQISSHDPDDFDEATWRQELTDWLTDQGFRYPSIEAFFEQPNLLVHPDLQRGRTEQIVVVEPQEHRDDR